MKVLSLFSGIGAFETALTNIGIDYELVNYCEIDKYASKAYSAIHNVSEDLNLHDVTTIDCHKLPQVDLITYGFPCQDISVAGRQKGFEYNGERTRSGLFFEALRIIKELKPKYAIAENVKALTSKKFSREFQTVLSSLTEAGYNNYYKVINAKDHGIPQHRERIFIVSIRRDIDNGSFVFPATEPLKLRLKDILEPEVDEHYYIRNEKTQNLITQLLNRLKAEHSGHSEHTKDIDCIILDDTQNFDGVRLYNDMAPTLRASKNGLKVMQVGNFYSDMIVNKQIGRVYGIEGLAPTLTTMQGGGREPKILEPVIVASRGRNPVNPGDRTIGIETEQRLEINLDGCANTLTTVQKDNYVLEPPADVLKIGNLDGHETGEVLSPNGISKTLKATDYKNPIKIINGEQDGCARTLKASYYKTSIANMLRKGTYGATGVVKTDEQGYSIRKLTPRECWRLMGFTDENFDKAQSAGLSNTQLYKMAGNSIVVTVLEHLFTNLLQPEKSQSYNLVDW